MEDRDDIPAADEQALSDRIDDEIINRELMERLDTNEWQISGIAKALSSLDRGEGIPHERVGKWVASWDASHERPSP